MSISFLARALQPGGTTWDVPGCALADPEALEVNVCNGNGYELLTALGLAPGPEGGPIPIDQFRGLITNALRRRLGKRSPALPVTEERSAGGATIAFLGRSEGYVERRLGDLAQMAARGRDAGATHILWE